MIGKFAPLIAAFLIVSLSVVFFFTESAGPPAPAKVQTDAPRPAPPVQLPPPQISKLSKSQACLHVEGDRYDGGVADSFGQYPREGVMMVNECAQTVNVIDLKVNDTGIAYVYSILPVRTVAIDTKGGTKKQPDRLVLLSRGGERCDLEGKLEKSCRMLPVMPQQGIFVPVPVRHWFKLAFKEGGGVTGFLLEPVDPKAPKKPREVPKMPDKGFKFKPLQ